MPVIGASDTEAGAEVSYVEGEAVLVGAGCQDVIKPFGSNCIQEGQAGFVPGDPVFLEFHQRDSVG
jgi:hypothetical protein